MFERHFDAGSDIAAHIDRVENAGRRRDEIAVVAEVPVDADLVPIVPDEARTFGMEALFRQVGIYAHAGQLYEPVDQGTLLYYKEAEDGQILEEGITEAGSLSSFIAATVTASGSSTIAFTT